MKIKFLIASCIIVIAFLVGCEVSEPGSELANVPPTTTITSAPRPGTTVNHYLELHWSGNDSDGEIAGFRMFVDGELVTYTTRTDTAISFSAPASGDSVSHTFRIQALDNSGDADPAPPEIQFYTTNTAPTCVWSGDNTVTPNGNVGTAFRLILESEDVNRSGMWYTISIDDSESWTQWSTDSIFLFCDTSLGGFPTDHVAISNSSLDAGSHTFYARCRDSGFAVSPIIARSVNVQEGRRPAMNEVVTRYNSGSASDSLYPDGSIYHKVNAEMVMAYTASAQPYRGLIHSYRYRNTEGNWQDWVFLPELILTDLDVGSYDFAFQARDMAGTLSDTVEYSLNIIQQHLSDSILIVDETRNGTGGPGSPSDVQVDDFYATMVAGYNVRTIDMTERGNALVSPQDVQSVGLILWHADDRTEYLMDDNRRILSEYMQRGGRVIFSGWDILSALTATAGEQYGDSDFEYRFFRAFSSARDPNANPLAVQEVTGFTGESGFPSVQIDASKVLPSWQGSINRSWTFEPRGECTIIGRATTRTPGYFQNNEVIGYYYDLSFRVAVFGVPLFFCQQQQVEAMFEVLMPRMMTGL